MLAGIIKIILIKCSVFFLLTVYISIHSLSTNWTFKNSGQNTKLRLTSNPLFQEGDKFLKVHRRSLYFLYFQPVFLIESDQNVMMCLRKVIHDTINVGFYSLREMCIRDRVKPVYPKHLEERLPALYRHRYPHNNGQDGVPVSLEQTHSLRTWTYDLRCKLPSREIGRAHV